MSMRWTVVVVNVERPNPILPDLIGGVLGLPCTHYSFWTIPARFLWAMR